MLRVYEDSNIKIKSVNHFILLYARVPGELLIGAQKASSSACDSEDLSSNFFCLLRNLPTEPYFLFLTCNY
jgi:hypothetical protein